jgi:hypothetical protein
MKEASAIETTPKDTIKKTISNTKQYIIDTTRKTK